MTTSLLYIYRHTLQVMFYSRFRRRLVKRRENNDCKLDAFIVYDSDTDVIRRWERDTLIVELNERDDRYRLESMDDLPFNRLLLNSIGTSMGNSKRTVIVLDNQGSVGVTLFAFNDAFDRMTRTDPTHDILKVLMENFDEDRFVEAMQRENGSESDTGNFVAYLRSSGKSLRVADSRFLQELYFFLPQPGASLGRATEAIGEGLANDSDATNAVIIGLNAVGSGDDNQTELDTEDDDIGLLRL